MLLRTYGPADHEQIIGLFLLNTPRYFHPQELQYFRHFLKENMDTDPYYVLEENGLVVASGGYYIKNNVGGLSWFMVHPDHHRKGLGSQLARHHLQILKDSNLDKIVVDTSQLVYPFYEKFGFVLLGTTLNHWGPGMHLYSMELEPQIIRDFAD